MLGINPGNHFMIHFLTSCFSGDLRLLFEDINVAASAE